MIVTKYKPHDVGWDLLIHTFLNQVEESLYLQRKSSRGVKRKWLKGLMVNKLAECVLKLLNHFFQRRWSPS